VNRDILSTTRALVSHIPCHAVQRLLSLSNTACLECLLMLNPAGGFDVRGTESKPEKQVCRDGCNVY
jgi:hypothetical protein